MKIALVALNGTASHSSLSIRCLARALEAHGHKVTLVEASLRDRTAHVLLQLYRADAEVYGFSCYIWNIAQMLSLAGDLKALRPQCRVVLGGPEVSFDTARFEALDFVDHIVTGEGEEAFPLLLSSPAGTCPRVLHGTPQRDFTARGIAYERGEAPTRLMYYESSRGCPFSCAFCLSSATEGVRAKSAADTLADLLEFEGYSGKFTVKLVDRSFNFNVERAKAIWRGLLSERYTKEYHFEVCAHLLDEESLALLAAFPRGKVRLELGLQSTNRTTLAAVSRHTDPKRVIDVARWLTAHTEVTVHLDLIAGLPFEGLDSFAQSFDAAFFACHELQLGFLKLLYGTAMRARAAEWGIVAMREPPYTVLETRWLSFADISLLQGVAALLERLCESGKFPHFIPYITKKLPPFSFFSAFHRHIEEKDGRVLQKISQRELFSHLAIFCRGKLPCEQHGELLALLRADHAMFEVRQPPRALFEEGEVK